MTKNDDFDLDLQIKSIGTIDPNLRTEPVQTGGSGSSSIIPHSALCSNACYSKNCTQSPLCGIGASIKKWGDC